ncbi:MAG: hypothetical protein U0Z26_00810 [Anaerolineales bacterium]
MHSYKKLYLYSFTIALLLAVSATWTVPAYADDGTPPADPSAVTQPIEPPVQDTATVDAAAPQTPPESAPVTTEVPQGTDLVVLDAQGESLPLASQEAAQAIVNGDPIWCPVGVATPVAGVNGCTDPGPANVNYDPASLGSLVAYLSSHQQGMDGVIWIASNYDKTKDNSSILINGATFATMKNFKLTLKGGWCDGTDVTCIGTVDTSKPSTFDVSLFITNWKADVTLSDIVVSGGPSTGIVVFTTKNISLTNVSANSNGSGGADLENNAGTGNISITNSHFNNNTGGDGLYVQSKGTITLKDVTANGNTGRGAKLDNTYAIAPTSKTITVSGTNSFNNNGSDGLQVYSNDVITLNNITANGNSNGTGLVVQNTSAATPKAVNLTGDNTFNQNKFNGLNINSLGQITVNNVIAAGTTNGSGAYLYNSYAGASGGVTLTGTNQFDMNSSDGLDVQTYGAIIVNNLVSTANSYYGAYLRNEFSPTNQPITLTGTNIFKFNSSIGLYLRSRGQITTNNVIANNNTSTNVDISNAYLGVTSGITMNGANQFNNSINSGGGNIGSYGAIVLNSITANANHGVGLNVDNSSAFTPKPITINGSNSFNNNGSGGLTVNSAGAITLSNLIVNDNLGAIGANINNNYRINQPAPVTLTGTNSFNHNWNTGLQISSYGAISTNNVTANLNGLTSLQGYGAYLKNDSAAPTAFNITMSGNNSFDGNRYSNLVIYTDGAVLANNLTAKNSVTNYGVDINNSYAGSTGQNVTLTGTNFFTGNKYNNLYIVSKGAISLSNITASGSLASTGAYVSNQAASSVKPITFTGSSFFNSNSSDGLDVYSNGPITFNNITANLNGQNGSYGSGAYIDATSSSVASTVTFTGTNTFDQNYTQGLYVSTFGKILVNNLNASNNQHSYGVYLANSGGAGTPGITLTGVNAFVSNYYDNLTLYTSGAVSIANVKANSSANGYGVNINNAYDISSPQPVTLSGTNEFRFNFYSGLYIYSYGAVTTNNLTVTNNGSHGAYVNNYSFNGILPKPIVMTGTNVFTANSGQGLWAQALGSITINNIIANNNTNSGAKLSTDMGQGAIGDVIVAGTNSFTGNGQDQLWVTASGAILVNNVTANNGGGGSNGVSLDNTSSPTPKPVTLTGSNFLNNNPNQGINIVSRGVITTNSITANNNGGIGALLDNSSATIAVNIIMNGTNAFDANSIQGLRIYSRGTITTNALTVTNTNAAGVAIDNSSWGGSGDVILAGVNAFNNNAGLGLDIATRGAVTLNNISADHNTGFAGVNVDNTFASAIKPVTLKGTNQFTNNNSTGLEITSNGLITTNNITATANGITNAVGDGVWLGGNGQVVMNGTNIFNGNYASGLHIQAAGNVVLNNLTANNNLHSDGLYINNTFGSGSVTLNGVNTSGNYNNGVYILSNGAVTLTKVNSDANGTATSKDGVYVNTSGAIKLVCGSLTNNGGYGFNAVLPNPLTATLQGVITAGNTLGSTHITGGGTLVTVLGCPLP